MASVEVTMTIPVPERGATMAQIEEWLKYKLNYTASIGGQNPLIDDEPDPRSIRFLRLNL